MTALDLDEGDIARAEQIQAEGLEANKRRVGRPPGSKNKSTRKTAATAANEADEKTLAGRCNQAFVDLAAQFEARDDNELADILRRRSSAMSQGLISLTRNIRVLRHPLVWALAFLEPTIAFWELGNLLARRYVARRQRLAYEHRMNTNGEAPTSTEFEVPISG